MKDIFEIIDRADDQLIYQIMQAVSKRYRKLYPDWEVLYLSAPAPTPARRQAFHDAVLALLQQYGEYS